MRGVRDPLLQVTMCIRREMVFDQQPDARVEFPLRRFKELLRWALPQLHEATNVFLYDDVRKVVW